MELFRIIKRSARKALRSCWISSFVSAIIIAGACAAVTLTESALMLAFLGEEITTPYFFLSRVPSVGEIAVCGGALLLFVLLLPMLALGFSKLHYSFAEGKESSISELFDYFSSFKNYVRAIWFSAVLSIKCAVCAVIAAVPGTAIIYFTERFIGTQSRVIAITRISLICIGIALILVCFILAGIFMQRWFLAPYYLAEGKSVHEAFSLSVKASKKRRGEIFLFRFSFVGWALISFFILPLIWSVPYYSVSCAIYGKYLIEKNEHCEQERQAEEDTKEVKTE